MACTVTGNISGEATARVGNLFLEAMRGVKITSAGVGQFYFGDDRETRIACTAVRERCQKGHDHHPACSGPAEKNFTFGTQPHLLIPGADSNGHRAKQYRERIMARCLRGRLRKSLGRHGCQDRDKRERHTIPQSQMRFGRAQAGFLNTTCEVEVRLNAVSSRRVSTGSQDELWRSAHQRVRTDARALHVRSRQRTKPLTRKIGTAQPCASRAGPLCEAQAERGMTICTRRDGAGRWEGQPRPNSRSVTRTSHVLNAFQAFSPRRTERTATTVTQIQRYGFISPSQWRGRINWPPNSESPEKDKLLQSSE